MFETVLLYLQYGVSPLKGWCHEIFPTSGFFMNQFPQAPEYTKLGRFKFFQKFAEIFAARGPPLASLTPVANG
jgi:hypothetical protein